jgi:hypothetical protein
MQEPRLNLVELSRLLETVDPAALLVAPRLLRRIIKYDRKLTYLGLQVPHRKSYVIGRDALLALAGRDELGVGPERALPATLLLLSRPEPEEVEAAPRGQTLVRYWRLLFHASVHRAVGSRLAAGRASEAAVRRRIHRIGQTEFNEVRTVLRQETYLLPPHDDRTVYEEFAALYLELSFFAAPLLPGYFSAIEDFALIDQILAEDVDASALYAATRLPGAPDPVYAVDNPDEGEQAPAPSTLIWSGSNQGYQDLLVRADKAAVRGNDVRAAIRRERAARAAPPAAASETHDLALADVGRLVFRLHKALHLTLAESEAWRAALGPLLTQAAHGMWPAEARLLYDLQKICVDHERPIYAPDLVEWAYAHFRRPLLRPLPDQPLVLAVKHLRAAVRRLPSARVTEPQRHKLSVVLHDALRQAECRLRACFRPAVRDALDHVGLEPQNFPERLGRSKLIEELLDRITERGFLNMSDVRDGLARNQLKLPDLSGPGEFISGDPLIRANRRLALAAPGVYRRGEVYLRWLQRGSALAFGTRPGRWCMLFAALPILGAFATIVFAQEMLHLFRLPHHLTPAALATMTGVLGVFYLLLLHWAAFRQGVVRSLHALWQATRTVLVDLPVAVLRIPAVRWFLQSRPWILVVRFVLKPLALAVLAWFTLRACDVTAEMATAGGGAVFLAFFLLLNSRLGRDLEEAFLDKTMRNWEYVRGLAPGLFRLFSNVFKTILEAIDRFLYAVDEWLRFRGGQGRLALVAKTALGCVWFLVTYVVRLYVNVFIEPTVNPIKHFPVVTVVAKFLVPFWVPLLEIFSAPFQFLGGPLAFTIAFIMLHSLPGAAGFLVWEFKEDWRLYRANRPRNLRPEAIGHHGETMLRLLKPGFHSGTLPKLYARLRRAERRAHRGGTWKAARRLRETLHHVEESIRHFADRELVAFLAASKGWTAGPIGLAAVEAGSNRVRLDLVCPSSREKAETREGSRNGPNDHNLELSFEEQAGRLMVHIANPGWLSRLSSAETAVLTTALLGLYHKAGVDLVREQIDALLAPARPLYDIGDHGLVLWIRNGFDSEVIYDFGDGPVIHPRCKDGRPPELLPSLSITQLFLKSQPVAWEAWVAAWERDQSGVGNPLAVLPQVCVLPACASPGP